MLIGKLLIYGILKKGLVFIKLFLFFIFSQLLFILEEVLYRSSFFMVPILSTPNYIKLDNSDYFKGMPIL